MQTYSSGMTAYTIYFVIIQCTRAELPSFREQMSIRGNYFLHLREGTHKKKFFFFKVVGPLRFPLYSNGLVAHATHSLKRIFSFLPNFWAKIAGI